MMWLMGLAGLVGAGAASFVVTSTDTEPEENDETDLAAEDGGTDFSSGNLLDYFDDDFAEDLPREDLPGYDENDDYLYELLATSSHGVAEEFEPSEALAPEPGWVETNLADQELYDVIAELPGIAGTEAGDGIPGIVLGDWINAGLAAEPIDFDAAQETLLLVWDDLAGDPVEPDVKVSPDPDDPEVMHVNMNGESVAEIYGDPDFSTADLSVIPLSSAMIAGLEPA